MGSYYSKDTLAKLNEGNHPDAIFEGSYPIIFNITNKDQLETLLNKGANIDLVCNGKTPLTRAVLKNNDNVVKMLLFYGANPNPVINDVAFLDSLTESINPNILDWLYIWANKHENLKEESVTDMNIKIDHCLSSMATNLHWPASYGSFMTKDDIEIITNILNVAQTCDYITPNLGWKYTMLWMVNNQFTLKD